MPERPPFDPLRHVFWLVAFVIGLYGFVIVVTAAVCIYHSETMLPAIVEGRFRCDQDNRLGELLAAALAAAVAFAGGFIRKRLEDDDKSDKGE
jgi:hypothetical protein